MKRLALYVELARPFTLIAPALGFFSGAITAIGAYPHEIWSWAVLRPALIGAHRAAVFTAASNALNQIYDLEIDRVNKANRPLPSGRMTMAQAWVAPALTARTGPSSPPTSIGSAYGRGIPFVFEVAASPSCPASCAPQPRTRPSIVSAHTK